MLILTPNRHAIIWQCRRFVPNSIPIFSDFFDNPTEDSRSKVKSQNHIKIKRHKNNFNGLDLRNFVFFKVNNPYWICTHLILL